MQPATQSLSRVWKRASAIIVTAALTVLSCQSLEPTEPNADARESDGSAPSKAADSSDAGHEVNTATLSEQVLCAQHDANIRTAVGMALVAARSPCSDDDDCVLSSGPFACMPSCPVSVTSANLAQFGADLDTIAGNECSLKPTACEPFAPQSACVPVRASCQRGSCVAQCDQPDWPDTDIEGQFVREGAFCGDSACPAFPETHSLGRYPVSCCTADESCGVFARNLGPDCFRREPSAPHSEQCPGESLFIARDDSFEVFDSLPGCCRPDQTCGLDTSKTWGAGCIARSDFARAAAKTCTVENMHFAELETISCDYQP